MIPRPMNTLNLPVSQMTIIERGSSFKRCSRVFNFEKSQLTRLDTPIQRKNKTSSSNISNEEHSEIWPSYSSTLCKKTCASFLVVLNCAGLLVPESGIILTRIIIFIASLILSRTMLRFMLGIMMIEEVGKSSRSNKSKKNYPKREDLRRKKRRRPS